MAMDVLCDNATTWEGMDSEYIRAIKTSLCKHNLKSKMKDSLTLPRATKTMTKILAIIFAFASATTGTDFAYVVCWREKSKSKERKKTRHVSATLYS